MNLVQNVRKTPGSHPTTSVMNQNLPRSPVSTSPMQNAGEPCFPLFRTEHHTARFSKSWARNETAPLLLGRVRRNQINFTLHLGEANFFLWTVYSMTFCFPTSKNVFTVEIVRNHVFVANPSPGTVNFFLCPNFRHLKFSITILILPASLWRSPNPHCCWASRTLNCSSSLLTRNTPIEIHWKKKKQLAQKPHAQKNRNTTPWWIHSTPLENERTSNVKQWSTSTAFAWTYVLIHTHLFGHNTNQNLSHSRGNTRTHQRQHSSKCVNYGPCQNHLVSFFARLQTITIVRTHQCTTWFKLATPRMKRVLFSTPTVTTELEAPCRQCATRKTCCSGLHVINNLNWPFQFLHVTTFTANCLKIATRSRRTRVHHIFFERSHNVLERHPTFFHHHTLFGNDLVIPCTIPHCWKTFYDCAWVPTTETLNTGNDDEENLPQRIICSPPATWNWWHL